MSDVNLAGKGGPEYTLPFVDDNYAGEDESGNEETLLLPDNGGPNYDFNTTSGERESLEEVIPQNPSDSCWTLSVEWPPAMAFHTLILNRISVPPGDTVDHSYTLYYLDECRDGTFTFESTLKVVKSSPQREYDLRLGFELIVADGELSVSIFEPNIDPLDSG